MTVEEAEEKGIKVIHVGPMGDIEEAKRIIEESVEPVVLVGSPEPAIRERRIGIIGHAGHGSLAAALVNSRAAGKSLEFYKNSDMNRVDIEAKMVRYMHDNPHLTMRGKLAGLIAEYSRMTDPLRGVNVDIVKEYALIREKKSNLSAMKRNAVVAKYESLLRQAKDHLIGRDGDPIRKEFDTKMQYDEDES